MDIDYLYSQRVDKQNEQDDVVNFGRATDPRMSALEHLVPEQPFSTEENPAEGISTVKAIAFGHAEGQRVYTFNSGNLDAALVAITTTPEIESEIRNAVMNGKEVTIHQNEIDHYGLVRGDYRTNGKTSSTSVARPARDCRGHQRGKSHRARTSRWPTRVHHQQRNLHAALIAVNAREQLWRNVGRAAVKYLFSRICFYCGESMSVYIAERKSESDPEVSCFCQCLTQLLSCLLA